MPKVRGSRPSVYQTRLSTFFEISPSTMFFPPGMMTALAAANHIASMQQQNEQWNAQMTGSFAPYGYPAMSMTAMAGQFAPQQ